MVGVTRPFLAAALVAVDDETWRWRSLRPCLAAGYRQHRDGAAGHTLPTAFFDGAPMGAAACGGNTGFPCQVYKIVLPADAVLDASPWVERIAADMGLYILHSTGGPVADAFCDANGRGDGNQPEACALTLPAGTYFASVVNFGPAYPENDPNPDWISLSITPE